MNTENKNLYTVSSSPHTHSGASVQKIMLDVIIALVPAMALSVFFFGIDALRLLITCVASCVAIEALCRKLMSRNPGITDLSAALTGILLALNLPPSIPGWMAIIGSVFAIAIAKQVFGGIGYNPFNPALIGRVAMLVSFPVAMTTWSEMAHPLEDAVTTATPLSMLKAGIVYPFTPELAGRFFTGNINGCIGEVSAAALLLGGIYLLFRRVISWHIPVSFIGTVALFAAILRLATPETTMNPLFHVLSGGLMMGAFFMATDMVTTPVTSMGMIVFGIGCGLLTMIIRTWGGYPEGVSFAILIMNAFTPLINKATKPGIFGKKK